VLRFLTAEGARALQRTRSRCALCEALAPFAVKKHRYAVKKTVNLSRNTYRLLDNERTELSMGAFQIKNFSYIRRRKNDHRHE
jgi:hypothetical protein